MMPEVRAATRNGDSVRLVLFVPAGLPFFADHFPGFPILPGVVQIDWAVRLARRYFAGVETSFGVDGFKCRAPVRPETELTLELAHDSQRSSLRFAYAAGERPISSGTVVFR
jgi:3-hydroxymyristoyl/3-hydroxydecanoyl-(acyl carrier protein) dehydratase